jgi:hypothetical protein
VPRRRRPGPDVKPPVTGAATRISRALALTKPSQKADFPHLRSVATTDKGLACPDDDIG